MFTLEDLQDNKKYKQLLIDLLEYTNSLPDKFDEDKLFIGGAEYYSNKIDDYNKLSTLGKIGVLSKSKRKAYVLNEYLKIIMDNNMDYIRDIIDTNSSNIEFTFNDIIDSIIENTEYLTCHDANKIDFVPLRDDLYIKVDPKNMDIYYYDRIYDYIRNHTLNE